MDKTCPVCQGHGQLRLIGTDERLGCWGCNGSGLVNFPLAAY